MAELSLESLAKRVEALERALAAQTPNHSPKNWRKVVGMFHDSEFMRAVDEVTDSARRLLASLETASPPRDREIEAIKAKARSRERFGQVRG